MNSFGESPDSQVVTARLALLDALEALGDHRDSIIVIGAQAVYLHTGALTDVALAEMTTDGDLAVDPRELSNEPLIENAMRSAGFMPSLADSPGTWISPAGIPVDLMVPSLLAGNGRRGVRLPPHGDKSMRKTRGIEATLVDFDYQHIHSLHASDTRSFSVKVAGPAGLLVAKLHKIADRENHDTRLDDKDAHDIYRILRAVPTAELVQKFKSLITDELAKQVSLEALELLDRLFAQGPQSLGSVMAGRAETLVGNPAQVALASSILAEDVVRELKEHMSLS